MEDTTREAAKQIPASDASIQPSRGPDGSRSRRELHIELLVFGLAVWLPMLFNAIATRIWPMSEDDSSVAQDMLSLTVHSIQITAPVVFFIWRSGEPWQRFGIQRLRPWRDFATGMVVFGTLFLAWLGFWMLLAPFAADLEHDSMTWPRPAGVSDYCLLLLGCVAIGVAEETTMRGYLIPRLEQLFQSPAKAILISSLCFASYHTYYNGLVVLSIIVTGIVFGLFFCALRRVWPLAFAHALWDFWSLL